MTSPPSLTPTNKSGSVMLGIVKSTCPGIGTPIITPIAIRSVKARTARRSDHLND